MRGDADQKIRAEGLTNDSSRKRLRRQMNSIRAGSVRNVRAIIDQKAS